MVYIREFEPDDAQQASEILVAAFKGFLQDRFDKTWLRIFSRMESYKCLMENRFMIFVAESGNNIVGVVKVTARNNGLG